MAPTPAQKDSDPKRILIQDTGKQDPDLREFHGPDPRRTLPHLNGDFPAHTSHLLFKALAELLQAQIAEIAVFQGGLLRPVFRIRDFLRRIRILGSSYTGLRIRTLLFTSVTFKMPTKISL